MELQRGEVTLSLRPLLLQLLEGTLPLDALSGPLDAAGLSRTAAVSVADDVRAAVLEPNCEVVLEPKGKKVVLKAPL